MERITDKDLEIRIERINEIANFGKGKKLVLSGAYGGVDARIVDFDNGRTESHLFHKGYTTKRELYDMLVSFKTCLELQRRKTKIKLF